MVTATAGAVPQAPAQEAPAKEAPAPVAKEQPAAAQPPRDYADYTVADIAEKSKRWRLEQVEAALEHERANANRKGAIAALEATIAAKQEKEG